MSLQDGEVETQPTACAAEPHAAEVSRMIDDPLVLDAEAAGDLACIYETTPTLRTRLARQQFAHAAGEGLPIGAGEAYALVTARHRAQRLRGLHAAYVARSCAIPPSRLAGEPSRVGRLRFNVEPSGDCVLEGVASSQAWHRPPSAAAIAQNL
jgi:hypothetical protein